MKNKIDQTLIENWYRQACEYIPIHHTSRENFIIYKGFKISLSKHHGFIIKDVRYSNMYTDVSKDSISKFNTLGFIKGADRIRYLRDKKRIESYKKKIKKLYNRRVKYKNQLSDNQRLNEKRIRNINKKIAEFVDLVFYYKTRVEQFN